MPILLAIESSCDDTAAAVVEKRGGVFIVHSHVRHSQVAEHRKTNGVVPEVAGRLHGEAVMGVVGEALERAGSVILNPGSRREGLNHTELRIANYELRIPKIDAIAVTQGPGLLPSLLVGVETAKALAFAWGKPLIGVHHIWGHLVSGLLTEERMSNEQTRMTKKNITSFNISHWRQPTLGLIVSGGHTELLLYDGKKIMCIGRTLDDAAGEAFDKVATMLGLPYPGGPAIGALAKKGDPTAFAFPRAMAGRDTLDMSFSGLKTAVRNVLENQESITAQAGPRSAVGIKNQGGRAKADVAASFQTAVADVLVDRVSRAIVMYKPKTVFVGGGVSANAELRRRIAALDGRGGQSSTSTVAFPEMEFTQDNAVMIGLGAFLAPKKTAGHWRAVRPFARMSLADFF